MFHPPGFIWLLSCDMVYLSSLACVTYKLSVIFKDLQIPVKQFLLECNTGDVPAFPLDHIRDTARDWPLMMLRSTTNDSQISPLLGYFFLLASRKQLVCCGFGIWGCWVSQITRLKILTHLIIFSWINTLSLWNEKCHFFWWGRAFLWKVQLCGYPET